MSGTIQNKMSGWAKRFAVVLKSEDWCYGEVMGFFSPKPVSLKGLRDCFSPVRRSVSGRCLCQQSEQSPVLDTRIFCFFVGKLRRFDLPKAFRKNPIILLWANRTFLTSMSSTYSKFGTVWPVLKPPHWSMVGLIVKVSPIPCVVVRSGLLMRAYWT